MCALWRGNQSHDRSVTAVAHPNLEIPRTLINVLDQGDETTTAVEGVVQEEEEEEEEDRDDDDSEGDIPFEPFDITNDGRILKTASQCSRGSWKRPEAGWDVTITVHRFCELSPPKATSEGAESTEKGDSVPDADDVPSSEPRVLSQVEPDFLQLAFRLGEDDDEGFPQVIKRETPAALTWFFRANFSAPCLSCESSGRFSTRKR